ncbi:MAG: glycosyltransferase family 4 protein [Anaerolineaceae bacterium]|nr:glycosyltransferase family 4 protein [Anaerolineaceae bacterium]
MTAISDTPKTKKSVAIINGLLNPIPPIKGGGPQIVIYNTALALKDVPFDWFVLSDWDPLLEQISYDRNKYIAVKTRWIDRAIVTLIHLLPERWIKSFFGVVRKDHLLHNIKIIRSLFARKVDLFVIHESYSLTYLCHLIYPRKKIVHYCHTSKMHLDLTEKRWNRLLRSATGGIISICENSFALTDSQFKSKPEHRWVIQNGVSLHENLQISNLDKNIVRQRLGIPLDDFVFLCVTRIHLGKGLDLLIKAFAEVANKSSRSCRLEIVGSAAKDEDGDLSYEIRLKERANQLADTKIHFTGFIPNHQLQDYYIASDFGVLPTNLMEGNSLFLMESLTMGLPVIATRIGGIPEVVREGRDGILIDKNDLERDLSIKMLQVIEDQQYWVQKEAEIQRAARKRFNYQRVASQFCQVVKEVTEPKLISS